MSTEASTRYYKRFSAQHLNTTCIWQHVGSPFPHGDPVPFVREESNSHDAILAMRSSAHHRATVEIAHDNAESWRLAPNGLPYTVREWKGNTFSDFADISIYYGNELRDVVTIPDALDAVEAIEWIQAIGLPTEGVGAIHQIHTVLYQGKEVLIEDAKDIIIDKLQTRSNIASIELHRLLPILRSSISIPESKLFDESVFKTITSMGLSSEILLKYFDAYLYYEDILGIHNFIHNHTEHAFELAAIERYFPIGERLRDMNTLQNDNEYRRFLGNIFPVLNSISNTYGNCVPCLPTPLPFDAQNDDDIARYFVEYLPIELATYLAILHGNSLAHCNIRPSNISALGFLVDPDTLIGIQNGKTRGDFFLLDEHIAKDTYDSMYSVNKVISDYNRAVAKYKMNSLETECLALFAATYMKKRRTIDAAFASLAGRGSSWVDYAWNSMFHTDLPIRDEHAVLARTKELLGS